MNETYNVNFRGRTTRVTVTTIKKSIKVKEVGTRNILSNDVLAAIGMEAGKGFRDIYVNGDKIELTKTTSK